MSISRYRFSNELIELITLYSDFPHEVGGAIFGKTTDSTVEIVAASFKHGNKLRICFDPGDGNLFYPPTGLTVIGTWHTHPHQSTPRPSSIDLNQWNEWEQYLIHLIVTNKKITIYSSSGKQLKEVHLKGNGVYQNEMV